MFEFIRTHQRLMQLFLLVLIVPSFVLVGVSSSKLMGDSASTVATVGGVPVTQQEWDGEQRKQMDRYRQMYGAQFDQKMFETPEAKQKALEDLVSLRAMQLEIAHSKMTMTHDAVQNVILNMDGLRKPDGSFDSTTYENALAAQGMTPEMHFAQMRRDMVMRQLGGAIQSTAFAPRTISSRLSAINEQEREVQELLFQNTDFVAQVKISDEQVKAYYEKNAAQFQIPEQAKVDYVVFDNNAVENLVKVDDAEIASAYDGNHKRFTTEEQRRASHILITVKKDAPAADKAAAKAKAEAILAEVRKAPGDFAKIAKEKSQDSVSAEQGGDLDVIVKGNSSLPKSVEDTVYKLGQGEISPVVESEFGYHILTVTSIKPAVLKPLADVKGEIAAELKKQKMSKKYSELAETFTNTVDEQSDSLKPVADKLGLKIQSVANVSRLPRQAFGAEPFNNAKFLKAVFSDDSLKKKRNTEAVEAGAGTLIAGHVVEFKPATTRALSEVDAAIRQRLTQEEAAKLAKKAGETKLAAVKASGDATGFGEVKIVARTKPPAIDNAAALEVIKADTSKLPAYVGVDLPGKGYGVYRIGKVSQPAQADVARHTSEQQQIASAMGSQEMYDYVEALRHKAKVKITAHFEQAAAKPEGDVK